MKNPLTRALTVFLLVLAGLPAHAGKTSEFTLAAQAYAGSRERQYKVYVPDGLTMPAPMVMVLHGCRQTHDDVLRDWGMVAAADRHRFILVAPFITSYDGFRRPNCWGFWFDHHRRQGSGEPEDLHRIGRAVEAQFRIDPKRRFVAGLSSGGAMAVVLSVTHNEYFAAAASAAGVPYGEEPSAVSTARCPGQARFHTAARVAADMRRARDHAAPTPLLVLQNNADCTVLPAAGQVLRDARLLLDGDPARNTAAATQARQQDCTPFFGAPYPCRHVFHTADGKPGSRSLVETVFYDGPRETPAASDSDAGHYWVGGEHGGDGRWSMQRGPSHPDIVWDFFSRHPALAAPASPVPTPPTAPLCRQVNAAPGAHVVAGRAVAGGAFGSRALASGDRRDLGPSWDFVMLRVTLYEGTDERWFADPPAGCRVSGAAAGEATQFAAAVPRVPGAGPHRP